MHMVCAGTPADAKRILLVVYRPSDVVRTGRAKGLLQSSVSVVKASGLNAFSDNIHVPIVAENIADFGDITARYVLIKIHLRHSRNGGFLRRKSLFIRYDVNTVFNIVDIRCVIVLVGIIRGAK